ncbi:MAG: DUF547 domain-containing protein [Phycisphaerae bacterium]
MRQGRRGGAGGWGAFMAGAVWLVAAGAGCGPRLDLFDAGKPIPPPPKILDYGDWAAALRENVKDGLVDYEHLAAHTAPLDRFLEHVASAGPESTPGLLPTRAARMCFYVNVYNAAVLKAVLAAEIPQTMHDPRRPRLDHAYRVRVDRQLWTLWQLREAARAESDGDARVEFWLCDAARGSPPLQARPLRAESVDEQLRRATAAAMSNPRMVEVDHAREKLNVATIIVQRSEAFIDYYKRQTGARTGTMLNVLLHLAEGMRREWLNTAVGYSQGRIPFERGLNRWTRATARVR